MIKRLNNFGAIEYADWSDLDFLKTIIVLLCTFLRNENPSGKFNVKVIVSNVLIYNY